MLTIQLPKAISKCCTREQASLLQHVSPSSALHANFLENTEVFISHVRKHSNQRLVTSFSSCKCFSQFNSSKLSRIANRSSSKRFLCLSLISDSSDYEFRSSRNIAISLFRRYRNVVDRGGGDNLKEFISAGVNAYALGCTDEGLRRELIDMKDSGLDIAGTETYGGRTSLQSKILSKEVDECILWLSIIFITILCTPQPTIVRWSSTSPVSNGLMLQWKGFCALIANAYYMKGMAWLPVKTLQLEQMAVVGHAEEPSIVSSRMLLVFSTLEVVSPQWPKV